MSTLNARTDVPRELAKLMELTRGRRYLIGMHIGIFAGTNDEQAFLASADDVQCQRLRDELLQRDAKGWPDDQPMPAVPVMPEPQPQATQAPENTQMQPPQFPRPVIPATVGQPQQPQMPQQPPMQMPGFPPQMQQPPQQQMPPQMPTMGMQQPPPFQQPQQPQMQAPAMPVGLPQMQAPQWQMPGQPQQAAPQAPVLPSGRAPAVPPTPPTSGLSDVLSKIAEVQVANHALLESIHKHSENNGVLLHKVLGLLITTAQMQGVPLDSLASAVSQVGNDESVKNFLQALAGGPNQGKA